MFKLITATFSPRTDRQISTKSIVPTNGIDIRVGKPPCARTIHVPPLALKASLALRHVSDGATIANTDPLIFEIILEYLDQNFFLAKMRLTARNPLQKLIGGSDMMLKLVKAWHLAEMLELPQMQNKLIDIFSVCYRQYLEARIQVPLCPEPFKYLRHHMFYHTKCEKFLIYFYAGLTSHSGGFQSEEVSGIPEDIARTLQQRRTSMVVRGIMCDRIARGDPCFKVSKTERTQKTTLCVLAPLALPTTTVTVPPGPKHGHSGSISSISTLLSRLSLGAIISSRGHRSRHSLPVLASMSSEPDAVVSRALRPALNQHLVSSSRDAPSQSLPTSIPMLSTRAPFMLSIPNYSRWSSQVEVEESSSDSDSAEYALFTPDLHPRNFPYHSGVRDDRRSVSQS